MNTMITDNQFILGIIALIFTNIIMPIVSYKIAQRKTKEDFSNKALQNRYKLLYSPLRSLLLETHITGASRRYYFDQRVKRALPFFKKLKFRDGINRLSFDFDSNPLYEVEFGDFPLEKIKSLVKANSNWADPALLTLLQEADRSTYETLKYGEENNGLLEKEMFELAEHIWNEYERLNRRLLP